MQGRLFTTKYTKTNTRKLRDRLYLNPQFTYRDSTFNFTGGEGYLVVSPHFYIHKHFQDSIHNLILNSKLLPQKKYTYSDLGFVLLKDIVEEQSATPFDVYCRKHFFKRLGAYNTDFNAHFNLDMKRVVPANKDDIFRSIFSFVRHSKGKKKNLLFVCNFTPVAREDYRVGVTTKRQCKLVLNSDEKEYGGSGEKRTEIYKPVKKECDGQKYSFAYPLPAYGVAVIEY